MPPRKWAKSPPGYTRFDQDFERVAAKFKDAGQDLGAAILHLEAHAMEREGMHHRPIPGAGGRVWKLRFANSSKGTGKSGGFRLIYCEALALTISGLRLYDKGERSDIPRDEIEKSKKDLQTAAHAELGRLTKAAEASAHAQAARVRNPYPKNRRR